ncbi:MAG: hypothetical protein JRI25_07430, partial [Deltaproteobacteria bacterium]|nr:hypothetical protein [Deltaproteobacteria bacterium]
MKNFLSVCMKTFLLAGALALVPELALAVCGDDILDFGEECDDGSTVNGDGCSSVCTFEVGTATLCSLEGDGDATLSSQTVVNGYYPPASTEQTLTAGDTFLDLGTVRGDATPLQVGDRLLVIQTQGADIDPGNSIPVNGPYGDGPGGNDRAGYLNDTNAVAGTYEWVVVAAAPSGGQVPIFGTGPGNGLRHSYVNSRVVGTNQGFRSWQVLRIPQYGDLTLETGGELVPEAWDGQ